MATRKDDEPISCNLHQSLHDRYDVHEQAVRLEFLRLLYHCSLLRLLVVLPLQESALELVETGIRLFLAN